MDYNRALKDFDPLIKAIAVRYARDLIARDSQGFDIVMSEAREAAWRAMKSYRSGNGTKLSSYIGFCVRRQFSLMRRVVGRKKNIPCFPLAEAVPDTNDPIRHFEEMTDIKKVLSPTERYVLMAALDNNLFQRKYGKPVTKEIPKGEMMDILNRVKSTLSHHNLPLPCRVGG